MTCGLLGRLDNLCYSGWAGDQDPLSGLVLGGSIHDLIMLLKKKIFFFKPVDDSLQKKRIGFPFLRVIKM